MRRYRRKFLTGWLPVNKTMEKSRPYTLHEFELKCLRGYWKPVGGDWGRMKAKLGGKDVVIRQSEVK